LRFPPAQRAPTAAATDADGDALTFSWNFGDGSTSTSQNPTHSYQQVGDCRPQARRGDNNNGRGNDKRG